MATVLVTGAGGFTGWHLAHELAAHGLTCVGGLSHAEESVSASFAAAHVADLLDADKVLEVVRTVQPKFVVHLAAVSFVAHGRPDDIYRTNIVGTRNLLEALASLPSPPEMTLLASSANVYGNAGVEVISENVLPAPSNDYAISKLAMEYVARLYSARMPIVTVRPFNYTGVGQSEKFLVPKIIGHARRKAPQIELGNLAVERDFSDVRMLVDCYRRLLSCPAAAGATLNVCSGRAYSLGQVLRWVEQMSDHALPVVVNSALQRSNEVKTLRGSRESLEKLIGPLRDVEFPETLRWMLQSPPSAAEQAIAK